MRKNYMKRVIMTALMIAVVLITTAIPSSNKKSKSEIANLREWYLEYKTNESISSEIMNVNGIVRTQATRYLGSAFWFVYKNSKGEIKTTDASVGYRVRRNSDKKVGFVTCGHGLMLSVDKYVYTNSWASSSAVFGKIEKSIRNSSCDASFVSVYSGTTLSNQTHGRGGSKVRISTDVVTVKKGDIVTKCGAKTGVLSGEVAWTDESQYFPDKLAGDEYTVNKVICTTYMSKGGDSGAPVYKNVNGTYKLVGIVIGGDDLYSTIVMDAKTINKKLGVTPY